jgi:Uma2 family endonuclease
LLHGISWETYERLLADHLDRSSPRFYYDRGELEIMSPSPEHEGLNRLVALLIALLAAELGIPVRDLGSTTFKREDLERGFEPDSCFYVQHEGRIRSKERIDLAVDPPPDLVVEIDITSPSLDKLRIYARLGVPEVWRHDGERLRFLALRDDRYVEVAESTVLPPLTSDLITRFVREGLTLSSPEWMRRVREWAQGRR